MPTDIIPINTPTHCHQYIFSLKTIAEKMVVNIKLPILITGYIKLTESVELANSITHKFNTPLNIPANVGMYHVFFRI